MQYFRYDKATGEYVPVKSSRSRMQTTLWVTALIVFVAAIVLGCIYLVMGTEHREQTLQEKNEQLQQQLDLLNRRADMAIAVMEDVIDRDNNFYRVMLQGEPITDATRYAGLERQRIYAGLDSLPEAELLKSITDKLDRLDRQIYSQVKSFDELRGLAATSQDRLDHTPAIQPVSESNLRSMASGYGYRKDPVYHTTRFHAGMDFAANIGTPVYATANGRVKDAGWRSGYGNCIDVDHGYNYVTRYAHLSKINVQPGQEVKRGEVIGLVGNTGKSTGPHLHYEVLLNGEPQNPVNYYFYDLTPEQYDLMIRQAANAGHMMD